MRKKKKQDNRLYCPYCGRQAVLRPAMYVYGRGTWIRKIISMSVAVIQHVILT